MIERWKLDWLYQRYVDIFEENKFIRIGGEDVGKFNQYLIQNEGVNVDIRDTTVNNSDEFLLEKNENLPNIDQLPPDILCWLPIGLTRLLQTQITEDHTEYWWFTYANLKSTNERMEIISPELIENFELMLDLVLVKRDPVVLDQLEDEYRNITSNSNVLATYLGYPTLEGFIKTACRKDIDIGGKVRQNRRIRKLGPREQRDYYSPEDTCSDLGSLIWHLETEVTRPEHEVRMAELREEIGELYDTEPNYVYGMLRNFRNNSLHGQTQGVKERGVLLNIISMVSWIIMLP